MQDALSALLNLGYPKNLAGEALDAAKALGAGSLEDLLRQSPEVVGEVRGREDLGERDSIRVPGIILPKFEGFFPLPLDGGGLGWGCNWLGMAQLIPLPPTPSHQGRGV